MNYQLPEPLKKYGAQVLTWALILFISVVVIRFGLEDSVTVVVPDFPQPPVEALFPPPVATPDPTPDTAVTYGYQTLVHGDGPDKLVVESGGEVEVKSGGILDAQTGSTVGFDDVTVAGDMTVAGTATFNITSPTLTQNLNLTGTLTAEDIVVTDTLDVNGDIDLDGDGLDVDITAGFSIDADAASNINVAGAGLDLTFESEAGSVTVKGDEAAATAITLDANEAAGTGITVLVGASGGLSIDGGLTDIGTGTYTTADGDNDLGIDGDLEVNTTSDLKGNIIDSGGALTFLDDAIFDLQADAGVLVQAVAAPAAPVLTVEDSAGTDVWAFKVASTTIGSGFNLLDLIDTLPALDGGDTVNGMSIALTGAASTGTTNTVNLLTLGYTTNDAQVSVTGLKVDDADFDYAIDAGAIPIWSSAQKLFADFLGDTIPAEHVGLCGTDPQCVAPALVQEQYGVVQLVSGDDGANCATDCAELAWGLHWTADQGSLVFEANLHIDTALTNAIVCAGLTDVLTLEMPATIGGGDTITTNADDALVFCFDDAADTDEWFAIGVAGTTDATGNGATGVAPAFGVNQVLRIEVDAAGAEARFYIDGALVKATTANSITVTDLLTPVVVVDTNAAASVTVDVDYFGVSAQRQ